jgi:putative PIN family toxin of toxin-antitoxin system
VRIVLDTNVLVAAYIARSGGCAALYEHILTAHTYISSEPLLAEFRDKLVKIPALNYPRALANIAVDVVRQRVDLVPATPLAKPVCRDPDDDLVLATALNGRCACIVTMDDDLLVLKAFSGIDILHPRDFWAYEAARPPASEP